MTIYSFASTLTDIIPCGSLVWAEAAAWVLSRGDLPASWRLLREALDADR